MRALRSQAEGTLEHAATARAAHAAAVLEVARARRRRYDDATRAHVAEVDARTDAREDAKIRVRVAAATRRRRCCCARGVCLLLTHGCPRARTQRVRASRERAEKIAALIQAPTQRAGAPAPHNERTLLTLA